MLFYSNFFTSFSKSSTSTNLLKTDANRMYAILSSFFSSFATSFPINALSTSVVSCPLSSLSMSDTIRSTCKELMVVFPVAFKMPKWSFSRSNRSRRPSRLITKMGSSSILSYVVNRFVHLGHCRLLLIVEPLSASLVSITSVSPKLQNGQIISCVPFHFRPLYVGFQEGQTINFLYQGSVK